MTACEKCWGDAWIMSQTTGHSQSECYRKLLIERAANPCSPEEQAGEWWDEETKSDRRMNNEHLNPWN